MSDLANKIKIGVRSGGSLQSRLAANEELRKQAPATAIELPNRIAIMIDLSGSMHGEPVQLLEKALQDFIAKSNQLTTAIAVVSFPGGIYAGFSNDKLVMWALFNGLKAGGGTPMARAMQRCLDDPNISKMTRAIIISDGQPDETPSAETQRFKSRETPVDTIHIGRTTFGEDVLREISEATGGLFIKFSDQTKFSQAFAYLLPETRANAATLMLGAGAEEVR